MAAVAVRRQHLKALGGSLRSLGVESDGHHMHNSSFGRGSFEFSNRTKSEQDGITEKDFFPRRADIIKDLEIGVLVGRNYSRFAMLISDSSF